jgi:hypothetical protein
MNAEVFRSTDSSSGRGSRLDKALDCGLSAATAVLALLTIGVGTAAGQTSSTVPFYSSYRAYGYH